ncbi:MAG: YabP/YqfC family sporulation protein [Clostridia bacterium]
MKKEDMQRYAASSLDLPAELAAGVPRIVVTGNQSVLVENHGGILGFRPDQIKIGCLYGEIVVEGKGLRLRLLKKDELEAEGEIQSVSFQKGEHR